LTDTQIPKRLPWGSRKGATIDPTSQKVVESIDLSKFKALKYFIIFFNTDNDITKEMEFTVSKNGSSVFSTVTNRIGIGMDLAIDAQVNGSSFEMNVTNNENYNLRMSYTRLTL